jgi:hypothetical protein
MELLRSKKDINDGWFGLWCLTPLSTISVILWQTVLLVACILGSFLGGRRGCDRMVV